MKVIPWEDFLLHGGFVRANSAEGGIDKRNSTEGKLEQEPVALTLGVFDGVHRGHQKLIRELQTDPGHFPVLFTFRENPAKLIPSKKFPGDISTFSQKLDYLESQGIRGAVIIDFSHDFSKLTGGEFFQLIRERINLKKVVLGPNHRLGHGGMTGARDAAGLFQGSGVEVLIPAAEEDAGGIISSTRIREALRQGRLGEAETLLGRKFSLDFRGLPLERAEGCCRIKTGEVRQILPPPGVYPVFYEENQEFIATKLILDERYIKWNQDSEIPAKTMIFC